MPDLPPLLRDQRKIDAEQLNLLSIFHFVLAGLSLVGIGFVGLHYAMMHLVFEDSGMLKPAKGGPSPELFFAFFKIFYAFAGSMIVSFGVVNLISGLCMRKRQGRVFSMIVAGLDCLGFPFGTMLGVFTLIVLGRDSVRELYDAAAASAPPLRAD